MKIFYKPLTANRMWKGRRFKSDQYKQFERDMLFLLPKFNMPEKPFSVIITFGMSNIASDLDNPCKACIDVMQKKYGFNDRDIMQLHLFKTKTEKGKEFINFTIEHCEVQHPK